VVKGKTKGNLQMLVADRQRKTGASPLYRERQFFESHRDEFSGKYKGRFLLIKGTDVIGAYATARDAYQAGTALYGWEPFLIQQV